MQAIYESVYGVLLNIPFGQLPVKVKILGYFVNPTQNETLYRLSEKWYVHPLSKKEALIGRLEVDLVSKRELDHREPEKSSLEFLDGAGRNAAAVFEKYFERKGCNKVCALIDAEEEEEE